MKKLVLFVAVIATVAFSACTGKAKGEEAPAPAVEEVVVEEVPVEVIEVVTDSTTVVETPAAE